MPALCFILSLKMSRIIFVKTNLLGVNFVKVRIVTIDLKHYLALVILKSLSVFLTIFKISAAVE